MKSFLIISLFFIICLSSGYPAKNFSLVDIKSETDSFYTSLIPAQKLELLKSKLQLNNSSSGSISGGETLQIAGGVCAAAFLVTVVFFKQDIFSTLPMVLLGSSVILVFLGMNTN